MILGFFCFFLSFKSGGLRLILALRPLLLFLALLLSCSFLLLQIVICHLLAVSHVDNVFHIFKRIEAILFGSLVKLSLLALI